MLKRNSITNENNKLIMTLQVQKKDLIKIIEFGLDLNGEIKNICDSFNNLNLNEYTEIKSLDIISFLMTSNWIIDYDIYNNFSLTELEIALKHIYQMIADFKDKLIQESNLKMKKIFQVEIKKYEYMLEELDKFYISKKNNKKFK